MAKRKINKRSPEELNALCERAHEMIVANPNMKPWSAFNKFGIADTTYNSWLKRTGKLTEEKTDSVARSLDFVEYRHNAEIERLERLVVELTMKLLESGYFDKKKIV
jgi:hypothetical protein